MRKATALVKIGTKSIARSKSSNMATTARGLASVSSKGKPSHWEVVPLGPPDPIMGLAEAFKKDTDERKARRTYAYG